MRYFAKTFEIVEMKGNLVIVESPTKATKIKSYLGNDFTVKSSYGHIRDLQDNNISIDLKDGFRPLYVIPSAKTKVVEELKKLAAEAETVWLASDEDREGEAIAWHLYDVLGLTPEKTKRIVFHEITKPAILEAVKNPRDIDMNLVAAQQARRVLDRLVGFELSPVLWKKIQPKLSAGRVQSVALRLVVDREREIQAFGNELYYKVDAVFVPEGTRTKVKATLDKRFSSREETLDFLNRSIGAEYSVCDVTSKEGTRSPAAPFTTSTLQQEAARKLGMSVSQTMQVAQKLYEEGLITYMRTDSVNLSTFALAAAKDVITELYGAEYSHMHNFVTKVKGAQEAHEAIRPTDMARQTVPGDTFVKHLYELIWKRTIASQMSDAKTEKTNISIPVSNRQEKFVATGEVILFPGFLKVYTESKDDENEEVKGMLPAMNIGEELFAQALTATQRFAQPPARYTEASLVKKLEELGIGRPSTYAPTITTIQKRGYVLKQTRQGKERQYECLTLKGSTIKEEMKVEKVGFEKDKIFPTDVGMVVNDYLQQNFEDIMDYGFTADVEKDFDEIAEGKEQWQEMLQRFYGAFHKSVDDALNFSAKASGERMLGYDPVSNAKVFAKLGKYGPMVQIGENYADEKPRYARLRPNQFIETITLEEALDLFKLPRSMGEWDGSEVTVGAGRFGPYVRHNNVFVSIPKDEDPIEITLERCVQLLEEKRKKDADRAPVLVGHLNGLEILAAVGRYGPYLKYDGKNITLGKGMDISKLTEEEAIDFLQNQQNKNVLRSFKEDENVKVMNGRYGAYITNGTDNFKIPKGTLPENLSYEECLNIISTTAPTSKKRIVRKKA